MTDRTHQVFKGLMGRFEKATQGMPVRPQFAGRMTQPVFQEWLVGAFEALFDRIVEGAAAGTIVPTGFDPVRPPEQERKRAHRVYLREHARGDALRVHGHIWPRQGLERNITTKELLAIEKFLYNEIGSLKPIPEIVAEIVVAREGIGRFLKEARKLNPVPPETYRDFNREICEMRASKSS